MMQESVDSKVGATGRILKAEYKRLSLEEEQDVYNSNARQLISKWSAKKAMKDEEAIRMTELTRPFAYMIPVSGFVAPPPPRMGWVHPGERKEAVC